MASTKQSQSLKKPYIPSELDYVLQPIREYNKNESLLGVAKWLLTFNNLNAQFAGETLLRAIETRKKVDDE